MKSYTKKVYTKKGDIKAFKTSRKENIVHVVFSRRLREDQELYMEGLDYTVDILEGTEDVITSNRDIILKGIQIWGSKAIRRASPELKRDDELVRYALMSDYESICYVDPSCACFSDKDFIMGLAIMMSGERLDLERSIRFGCAREEDRCKIISYGKLLWSYLHQEVKNDREIYYMMVEVVGSPQELR